MINKIDSAIHKLIDRYIVYIGLALLLIISVLIRIHLAPVCVLSADYNNFLVPWVEYYRENGIMGLSQRVGDYYVPYNLFLLLISYLPMQPWIMIAAFSALCDYISAIFIYKIAMILLFESNGNIRENKIKAAFAGILTVLLPFTFLNSTLWKQCDSVYVSFLIISLYFVLKSKGRAALCWFTVAFLFKLQALFLFPLFIILYILKECKISIFDFLIVPLGYIIAGLPAVLAGRRFTNVYGTYFRQMTNEGYNAMSINFPNIYSLGLNDYPALSKPAIYITMGIFIGFVCFIIKQNSYRLSRNHTLYISIWCMWTCVMFLPSVHERYNFAVLLLASIYFVILDKTRFWIPLILNLMSIVLYSAALFGAEEIPLPVMAVVHVLMYVYITYDLSFQIRKSCKVK